MNFSQLSKYHWTWLVLILAIVFIDQQSKLFVVEQFNVYDRYTLTAFLDFTRLHNTGAAFSLFASDSGWQRWPLILISAGGGATLIGWLIRNAFKATVALNLSLALIAGGAIGNLVEIRNQELLIADEKFNGNKQRK